MTIKPCLTCNTLFNGPGARCPTHTTGTGWNNTRNTTNQGRFRQAVMHNAGHQCQWRTNGTRCPATHALQAHHTDPGNDDPQTGLALCRPHHRLCDKKAR